ncbi:3-hydroxyisobutyrate dehydrogenase [Sinorhizobium meliloti]|uniref:NADPH-dependent F420 reductase n=1 Tax=Rhizobium meliloti TaxID=382 RepID=UPI00299EA343|nr:3-hydroxyisobutyrate dehydrogenase [Sinorhizobium meliloti]MDW9919393.1 3-hydroxyisobutyrate dehydrogenase [Sinorhizobium meliloti]MDX0035735.1 3-hydroxyisobutyrate dehydrogenase [Sinorhizobium meliloti]MDX0315746.1 3-hydroxyisobutyrate dehydrogenase [Sinorhizobium meliloti]MDX0363537.1 3-hydroxyisobutyrate dehydrogenase [Sinorhizobium meliloti]
MKIGIIGTGLIGANLARKWVAAGHSVRIANDFDPSALDNLARETRAQAVPVAHVVKDVEVIVTTIPLHAIPSLPGDLFDAVPDDVILVDTSNYFPARDRTIPAIEEGMVESQWVAQQIGRPVIKAFNNQLAYTQAHEGKPAGTPGRIAMSVYGDDAGAKMTVVGLINDLGFDGIDAGPLAESWRQQPGTPAYCTELTAPELREALGRAVKDRSPKLRDLSLKYLDAFGEGFLASLATGEYTLGYTSKDVVQMYRRLELEEIEK